MSDEFNIALPNNELIQYFIDGLSNLMAMNQAKATADYYENSVVNNLNSIEAKNGVFITPQDIPVASGEEFVKQSVNAHLAKVQSDQISEKTSAILNNLEQSAKNKYIGRKLTITKINDKTDIFDAVMFDSKSGEYRTSNFTKNSVKGTIEDISIANNLLVIKPTFLMRQLVPNRVYINIYVLNINDFSPNIKIS